jgi:YD repeat-containing protein
MPLGGNLIRTFAALSFIFLVSDFIADGSAVQSDDDQSAESTAKAFLGSSYTPSDREKAGLRGPVKECRTEIIYPSQVLGEPILKASYADIYSLDGRIQRRTEYDGSKSFAYDDQGHLVSETWDGSGGPDLTYGYDSQGRLVSVVGDPDQAVTFEYDDRGRKTRIVKSELNAQSQFNAQSQLVHHPYGVYLGGIEYNDDLSVIPSEGGMVKTLYDEHDRAVESRVYDFNGQLTNRLKFTYDLSGRVAELLVTKTKPEFLVSPQPGEEVVTVPASAKAMAGDTTMTEGISYVYGDQDRVVEEDDHGGLSGDTVTKIAYNEHGDESMRTTTGSGDIDARNKPGNAPSSPAPELPEPKVEQFTYKYDSFGNWIEKADNSPATAQEPARTWSITHRLITYY